MTWIQVPESQSGSRPPASVAIVSPDGLHTGIVYVDGDEKVLFLHLAFHHLLRRDEPGSGIGWVLPADAVPHERLELVAAMCDLIWERHQKSKIPYGFRYNASKFSKDGTLELGADECGLTCATFVLAVYRAVGLELLDLTGWPERADDAQRFAALLETLRQRCTDQKHIDAVSKEVKSVRYRPLEVAGGSRFNPPACFADATEGALAIERELSQK